GPRRRRRAGTPVSPRARLEAARRAGRTSATASLGIPEGVPFCLKKSESIVLGNPERESKGESAALPGVWPHRSAQGGGSPLAAAGPSPGGGGGQGQPPHLPRCPPRSGPVPSKPAAPLFAGDGTGRHSQRGGNRRRRPSNGRPRARFPRPRRIRAAVFGLRRKRIAIAFGDGLRDRLGLDRHLLHL